MTSQHELGRLLAALREARDRAQVVVTELDDIGRQAHRIVDAIADARRFANEHLTDIRTALGIANRLEEGT